MFAKRLLMVLALIMAAVLLIACQPAQEAAQEAGEAVEEAAEDVGEAVEEAATEAVEAAEEVVEPTEEATEEMAAEEPAEEAPAEEEGLTFGVILVGPRNDHGWSQAHVEAGEYVEENFPGAQMIVFESLNSADKPEATVEGVVDDMVAQGASLIFTTSDEFEEDTVGVAEKYPEVTFISVTGDDAWVDGQDAGVAPPNEGNIMGKMIDMKAVAGCAAAMASDTGHIAYLGPLINFETRRLASAAYLGARHCWEEYRGEDPASLQFTVTWIGFWFNIPGVTLDPTEVVNQFYDSGADVVLSGIDTTEAVTVAGQRAEQGENVYAIPYDYSGACDEAPDICLGVPYFNWGPEYLKTVQAVADGTWEQSFVWNDPYWDDLNDIDQTPVGWVSGPALEANPEWQANVDEFIAGMASGDVSLWSGPLNLQDGTEYIADGAEASEVEIWYLPQLLEGMEGPSE